MRGGLHIIERREARPLRKHCFPVRPIGCMAACFGCGILMAVLIDILWINCILGILIAVAGIYLVAVF